MFYHLVVLVTDPDLAYIVRQCSCSVKSKTTLETAMFEHENTLAVFKDIQRAKEYAAYMNLKLNS